MGQADDVKSTVAHRLRQGAELIRQAVKERDTRALVGRVLRETNALKHELAASDLSGFLKDVFPEDHPCRRFLLSHLIPVLHFHSSVDMVFISGCRCHGIG